jgi:hypothetical protein
MRINLKTPFAEKEAVKALGARWDAARKIWFITDIADLTPFMRWIPDLQAASEAAAIPAVLPSASSATRPAKQSQGVITSSSNAVQGCACNALPWEDCEHTRGN